MHQEPTGPAWEFLHNQELVGQLDSRPEPNAVGFTMLPIAFHYSTYPEMYLGLPAPHYHTAIRQHCHTLRNKLTYPNTPFTRFRTT